jgi:protein-tyrosine phosphatase
MQKIFFYFLAVLFIFNACKKPPVHARYKGEDLSGIASIQRDKKTKTATLHINTKDKWSLYSGRSVESINFFKPLLKGEGSGTFKLDVPDSVRSYFLLETEKGKAILAERQLPMEGGYNFRDLGGIRNKDGYYTQWGKIFRSDELHNLTEEDIKYLTGIPITSLVDFRSRQEIDHAPDKVPSSVKNLYQYSIAAENLIEMEKFSGLTAQDMDSLMMKMNISFVTDSAYLKQYKDFFKLLQNENEIPLMFHCSAGKDRTGTAAALILFALGVDEETIMEDYLASNKYLGNKYAKQISQYPQRKSLFRVKPEFLQAGIDRIKEEYGTIENFLSSTLEVDLNKFQNMYLYKY